MEIRCDNCGHVGPAASVVPGEHGVALICENCSHENLLDVPGAVPKPTESPKPKPRQRKPDPDTSAEGWLTKGVLERLIPAPGDGLRCRKCAYLLEGEKNCPRCGLNVDEGHRFPEGEAPWERPPEGLEAPFEQATLLWKSVEENPTDDNLSKFVAFSREEGLLEYGIRKLRFFLVDHPNHERATSHLEELAESFQAKMIVARARAEVGADNIVEATHRAKRYILIGVFILWGSILLMFLSRMTGC